MCSFYCFNYYDGKVKMVLQSSADWSHIATVAIALVHRQFFFFSFSARIQTYKHHQGWQDQQQRHMLNKSNNMSIPISADFNRTNSDCLGKIILTITKQMQTCDALPKWIVQIVRVDFVFLFSSIAMTSRCQWSIRTTTKQILFNV